MLIVAVAKEEAARMALLVMRVEVFILFVSKLFREKDFDRVDLKVALTQWLCIV